MYANKRMLRVSYTEHPTNKKTFDVIYTKHSSNRRHRRMDVTGSYFWALRAELLIQFGTKFKTLMRNKLCFHEASATRHASQLFHVKNSERYFMQRQLAAKSCDLTFEQLNTRLCCKLFLTLFFIHIFLFHNQTAPFWLFK